jgi:hypothetical protein
VQYTWEELTAKGTERDNKRRQRLRDAEADQDRAMREGLR